MKQGTLNINTFLCLPLGLFLCFSVAAYVGISEKYLGMKYCVKCHSVYFITVFYIASGLTTLC